MMNPFFTSDPHLGHVRALEIMPARPWKTIDEMNHGLIDRWNDTISPNDTVIILGDLVMGKKQENVPKFIPQLAGHKILVCGNHDFLPSECDATRLSKMEKLYKDNGISEIYYGCIPLSKITSDIAHVQIKLCHFPPLFVADHGDEYEKRYSHLCPTVADNEILLHGHTHSNYHMTAHNAIHVGVDATLWQYAPVSLDRLLMQHKLYNEEIS